MIVIDMMGIDTIMAISEEKKVHKDLCAIYSIEEDELIFRAIEGYVIHNGVEQTSFLLSLEIQAPTEFIDKEDEVKAYLYNAFKDVSIHKRILFKYFDAERETVFKDETYPLYMSDKNVVHIENDHNHDEEDEEKYYQQTYEEPYMGDILSEFDNYIKEHPDASNKEVYDALSGIRKEVNNKNKRRK